MQSFNTNIDYGISAPGNEREVVYGLNDTDKRFIFHLMATDKIPGSRRFDTQMTVNTATQNTYVILAPEFQKHYSNE